MINYIKLKSYFQNNFMQNFASQVNNREYESTQFLRKNKIASAN